MGEKFIYLVYDDGQDSFNELIGIFDTKEDAETYAIKMAKKWFDECNICPKDREVETNNVGDIIAIHAGDLSDIYIYISKIEIGYKCYDAEED